MFTLLGKWIFRYFWLNSSIFGWALKATISQVTLWHPVYSLNTIHLYRRLLSCECLPYHIDSIPWLRRVLILKMMGNFFESLPHFCPLIPVNSPKKIQQESRFDSIWCPDKHTEFWVIQGILIWQLDVVTNNHRNTMANNGIKKAIGGRGISSYV